MCDALTCDSGKPGGGAAYRAERFGSRVMLDS